MKNETYHHGNLKQDLIEAGIKIISEESIETLSLRRVAKNCGVSNAAPYAHFKNKEQFITDIYSYIEAQFVNCLKETVTNYSDSPDILVKLGTAYVLFFVDNPHYYYFLFSRKNIEMDYSLMISKESSNKPLEIFKKISLETLSKSELPIEIIQNKFIAMWALVHGLANIATMPNSESEIDWKLTVEGIIQSLSIPYRHD